MVSGGGLCRCHRGCGFAHELANHCEYSGAPNENTSMSRGPIRKFWNPLKLFGGKLPIIGGGFANFTNVAAIFKRVIRALQGRKWV